MAGGLGALDAAMGGAGGMKIVSNSRVLIGVVSSFKATRILVQESGVSSLGCIVGGLLIRGLNLHS